MKKLVALFILVCSPFVLTAHVVRTSGDIKILRRLVKIGRPATVIMTFVQ